MNGLLEKLLEDPDIKYIKFLSLALKHNDDSRFDIETNFVDIIKKYNNKELNIELETLKKLLLNVLFEFNRFIVDNDDFDLFKKEVSELQEVWSYYPFYYSKQFKYPIFKEIEETPETNVISSFLLYRTFFIIGVYILAKDDLNKKFSKYVDVIWPNFYGEENIKMHPFWLINLYLYENSGTPCSEQFNKDLKNYKIRYFLLYLTKLLITNYKNLDMVPTKKESSNIKYNFDVLSEFCKEKNIQHLKKQLKELGDESEKWNDLFFHLPLGDFEEKTEDQKLATYKIKDNKEMNAEKAFKRTEQWIKKLDEDIKSRKPETQKVDLKKIKVPPEEKSEIKEITEEINPKFIEVKEKIQESYIENSFIPHIANAEEYFEVNKSRRGFIQIAYRTLIDRKWVERDDYMGDPIWWDIGRIIAFGEVNHIVKLIATSDITPRKIEKDSEIYEEIKKIAKEIHNPDLIFIPNEVFLNLDTQENYKQGRLVKEDKFLKLVIDDTKLRIIHESEKTKFGNIIILDNSCISWIYKPYEKEVSSEKRRLQIFIEEYKEDNSEIDITAKTVVKVKINHPEEIRIISLQ
ncbi:MAG: hypothetical protein K8E24_006985 [Methanobacterium paludis]|nr:hypothetical protein [Methanobacterium paludis]